MAIKILGTAQKIRVR